LREGSSLRVNVGWRWLGVLPSRYCSQILAIVMGMGLSGCERVHTGCPRCRCNTRPIRFARCWYDLPVVGHTKRYRQLPGKNRAEASGSPPAQQFRLHIGEIDAVEREGAVALTGPVGLPTGSEKSSFSSSPWVRPDMRTLMSRPVPGRVAACCTARTEPVTMKGSGMLERSVSTACFIAPRISGFSCHSSISTRPAADARIPSGSSIAAVLTPGVDRSSTVSANCLIDVDFPQPRGPTIRIAGKSGRSSSATSRSTIQG